MERYEGKWRDRRIARKDWRKNGETEKRWRDRKINGEIEERWKGWRIEGKEK
jgi:hypothetical protein